METITRLGTVEDIMNLADHHVAEICLALRKLISELHPNAVEVPRKGDRAISYGLGEKKMSEAYAYIMPQKEYANLGFYYGALLDPDGEILEGTGKKLRHMKLRSPEEVKYSNVKDMIERAIQERREALGKK